MPSRYNFHRFRRRSIRLKGYDYRKPGYYFVTFCTKNRERFFGTVVDAKMQLSKIGEIACQCWYEIPKHFNHVQLDAFIVMPDHIHGIIIIDDYPCGRMACHAATDEGHDSTDESPDETEYSSKFGCPLSGSLSTIIGSFKSAVSKIVNQNGFDFGWQSRFYEHIIRNQQALDRIRCYIENNPINWLDKRN